MGNDLPPVHHMKLGPDGKPYGIGSTEQKEANVYGPPVVPHYRVRVEQGQVIFEKMIFWHMNGHEHSWKEFKSFGISDSADYKIFTKLQEMVDMGVIPPIEVSAYVDPLGRLSEPILNEKWETVVEMSEGSRTGRIGKVRRYRKGGKEYAGMIVWEPLQIVEKEG